jgi:hypothetical protein
MIIKLPSGVVFRTMKISELRKRMNKQLAKITEKVNANPDLLEVDWQVRDSLANYTDTMKKFRDLEARGITKLWVFYATETASNPQSILTEYRIHIDLPLGVLHGAKEFNVTRIYKIREPQHFPKHMPQYFIAAGYLRLAFSFTDTTTFLYIALPTNAKIPIEYIPVFENDKVIFVKRDKADKVTPQNSSPSLVTT